jgi:hypothetical protein
MPSYSLQDIFVSDGSSSLTLECLSSFIPCSSLHPLSDTPQALSVISVTETTRLTFTRNRVFYLSANDVNVLLLNYLGPMADTGRIMVAWVLFRLFRSTYPMSE